MLNSRHIQKLKHLVFILPLILLNACGGGSGSADDAPPPANNWDQMTWDQGRWQ